MRRNLNRFLVLICVALLSASVAFLTACDPLRIHYELDNLRAPVKAIELINYDNPNQKSFGSWVFDHSDDLKSLDMSAMQTQATLDANLIDDFMRDLSEKAIMAKYYDVDSPSGTCIKIIYEDDYFDILCDGKKSGLKKTSRYIGTFTPDGKLAEFIGAFAGSSSFKDLLQTYFDS